MRNPEARTAAWYRGLAGAGVILALALVTFVVWPGARPERAVAFARRMQGYPARILRGRLDVDERRFPRLATSQLGYGPRMRKHFTSPRPFSQFTVVDLRSGSTVMHGGGPVRSLYTDVLGPIDTVYIGDFSEVRVPGRYRVVADNGMSSYPFDVNADVFRPAVRAVQRAFYFQRAFTAIEPAHAEGPWTHASDAALAPENVRKGWHDAGDFSIYNAQATSSLFWLLEAYNDFTPTADDTNIPESGNGVPDLLDEARWELEWMLSVQDPSGGFRNTTCMDTYGPYGTNAHGAPSSAGYRAGEVGTIPTGRAVGILAYASTVFRPFDREFATRSLDAAERGWRYLEARPGQYTDGPTCPAARQDGDAIAGRHTRMFASAGMLLATSEGRFQQAFDAIEDDLSNDPSTYRPNIYAALLYLRAPHGSAERKQAIVERLARHVAEMRDDAGRHPFEWTGRYFWGSVNAGFERGGAFGVKSCLSEPDQRLEDCEAAAANVHYALGRNLYQLSYINGLPGVTHGHARSFHQWLAALNAEPFLFPGLVAGGPNQTPEPDDISVPHARPVAVWGYWGDPAMPRDASTPLDGRYTDNDSWSTNEIDVVWQAAALYNLYFVDWLARRGTGAASTDGSR